MSRQVREITYRESIREALREEMLRDPDVFLLGEDIGVFGGAFAVTRGLLEEFGEKRVKDTPISEAVIVGAAVGAAITGTRPVAEIMYMDFVTFCMDQIVNQAAKARYVFGGNVSVPMVIRMPQGGGKHAGAHHSQNLERWFVGVPGLKVVVPSTPYDAKGLLKSAIRDNDPVIYIEHKLLYGTKGIVPEEEYTLPLGSADIKRKGKDVTIVAYSRMLHLALRAAEELAKIGVDAEVIDPRTLVPLDIQTIVTSVEKTGRVLIVEEGCKTGGVAGEIMSQIVERAFDFLDAPVKRVAGADVPIPCSPVLEKAALPDENKIVSAVKELCNLEVQ